MGGKGISGPDLSLTFLKEQEPVGYSHEGDMILQKGKSMSKSRGKSSTEIQGTGATLMLKHGRELST